MVHRQHSSALDKSYKTTLCANSLIPTSSNRLSPTRIQVSPRSPSSLALFTDAKALRLAPSQPLDGSTTNVKGLAQTRPAYNHRYSASDRHQLPGADDADVDEMGHRFGRKRQRSEYPYDDDNDSSAPILARRGIRVCDHNALWKFYDQRFKSCQQSACKLIAKAWVKAVEPKKQSTHPYTGSDEKAPDWWPKPWGTSKEEKVRHKEPDHLYKRGMYYDSPQHFELVDLTKVSSRASLPSQSYPQSRREARVQTACGHTKARP